MKKHSLRLTASISTLVVTLAVFCSYCILLLRGQQPYPLQSPHLL
jgi:hypothetical protein